jgi:hypothetical protein
MFLQLFSVNNLQDVVNIVNFVAITSISTKSPFP